MNRAWTVWQSAAAGRGMMLLCLMALANGCAKKDLDFTVTFNSAEGLQVGQKVTYKGVAIGEVRGVDVEPGGKVKVSVNIPEQHKKHVYKEAEFHIDNAGGLINVSGEKVLEMSDRGDLRTPIKTGDILEGSDSLATSAGVLLDKVRGHLARGLGMVQAELERLGEELLSTPEGKDLVKVLEELQEKGKEVGKEGYEKLRKEYLPLVKEKAARLKEELDKRGMSDKASEVWKDVEAAMDKTLK